MFLELEVTVHNGRCEKWEVSTLFVSLRLIKISCRVELTP